MEEIVVEALDVHTLDPKSADAQRLTDLVHEMSDWYRGLNESGIQYYLDHSEGGRVFVIREGGIIMAAACYEVKHERGAGNPVVMSAVSYPVAFVHGIVTAHEAQGKGYGSHVFSQVIENAREAGIPYAQLTCNPEREVAIRLYKRLGFKEIGNKQKVTDVTKVTTLFELDLAKEGLATVG